jgi:hypothetical protein
MGRNEDKQRLARKVFAGRSALSKKNSNSLMKKYRFMNIKPFVVLAALAIINCSCDRKEVDKLYYESGELKKTVPYENGKVDGTVKIFYKNGELKKWVSYEDGQYHGEAKTFYKDGTLKTIEQWRNDELHGRAKAFYSNGSLKHVSLYKKDSLRFVQAFKKDGSFKGQRRDVDVKVSKDTVTVGEQLTINTKLYGRLKHFDSVILGIAPLNIAEQGVDTVFKDTIQTWGPNAKGEIVPSFKYNPVLGESPLDSITYFSIVGNKKYNNGNVQPNKRGMKKSGTRKAYQFQYTPKDTGLHCIIGYYRLIPKDPSFTKSPQAGAFPVQFYVKEKPEKPM